MFKVKLENGHEIEGQFRKMRMHYIRILPGDSGVKMSPYDLTGGGIIFRYK